MIGSRAPRVCLFSGPSLAGVDLRPLRARIPAEVLVLPPVQQGDLLRLEELDPTCVAIVDGAFFQVPSVTHKEILLTLERGVRVVGASSLGALRAAELDAFGMEGVGEIYTLYKRGTIDGDDEVALAHSEAADGYTPLTEPLVNIRHNVQRARARGLISGTTATRVIACAEQQHFTRRTYSAVFDAARGSVPAPELEGLARLVRYDAVDLKRADALALLDVLADRFASRRAWPAFVPEPVNRTIYAHLFAREYQGRTSDGRYLGDACVLSFFKLLSPSASRTSRRVAQRCLAVDEAHHRALAPPDQAELIARFRSKKRLRSERTFQRWLIEHCLRLDELGTALAERDLERQLLLQASPAQIVGAVTARTGMPARFLLNTPRMRPGIPWDGPLLRETKISGAFRTTLVRTRQIVEFADATAAQLPGLIESLACDRLEGWFAGKWGVRAAALPRALIARGFSSYREFIDVARPAYVHARLDQTSATP